MTKTHPSDWIYFAESDLRLAYKALEEELFHLVCFHAQQAVEKFLKAQYAKRDKPIPKVHSLTELVHGLVAHTPELKDFQDDFISLDRFYLPTRYPDALPGSLAEGLPIRKDAEEALAMAQKVQDYFNNPKD